MATDCRTILERASIKFPFLIGLEDIQELIEYVCENLPGRANYHAGFHHSVGVSFTTAGEVYRQRGTIDLAGMIARSDGSAFDSFVCEVLSGQKDTSKFGALTFQTIHGYDNESEYGSETLKLWGDVRIHVNSYFQRRDNLSL